MFVEWGREKRLFKGKSFQPWPPALCRVPHYPQLAFDPQSRARNRHSSSPSPTVAGTGARSTVGLARAALVR